MKATRIKIASFLVAGLLALLAPIVYADGGNASDKGSESSWSHHHHFGKGGFFQQLTDDQKKQLKDIWQKQETAKKATIEQIKADKEALTNELLETTPNANKINDLKAKMEALMAQMLDDRINSNLQVKKILNNEQFAKYLEFQNHKFHGHHHGNWGHHDDKSSTDHDGKGDGHNHWGDNEDNE